jgi:hypothetical protein
MEAKLKAKELVDKFSNVTSLGDYEAKQCAIIAIDEILDVCKTYLTPYHYEVKKEIEKL